MKPTKARKDAKEPRWEHKSYFVSIPFKDSKLIRLLSKKQWEARKCLDHEMGYTITCQTYRKYRRGKHRCVRCGVKV